MCACVAQDYTYSKQPSHGVCKKIGMCFWRFTPFIARLIYMLYCYIVRRKIIYIYDCRKIIYMYVPNNLGPYGLCIFYLDPPAHNNQPQWNTNCNIDYARHNQRHNMLHKLQLLY